MTSLWKMTAGYKTYASAAVLLAAAAILYVDGYDSVMVMAVAGAALGLVGLRDAQGRNAQFVMDEMKELAKVVGELKAGQSVAGVLKQFVGDEAAEIIGLGLSNAPQTKKQSAAGNDGGAGQTSTAPPILRGTAGVSEAEARSRNPERSEEPVLSAAKKLILPATKFVADEVSGLPSAEDLDRVAEEQALTRDRVAEMFASGVGGMH